MEAPFQLIPPPASIGLAPGLLRFYNLIIPLQCEGWVKNI